MTAWRVHRWWFIRTALILAPTGLAEAAVGGLAAKPFPWVVLIPSALPLLMIVFVAVPLLKQEGRVSQTNARGRD
jgi:hypothetical protein